MLVGTQEDDGQISCVCGYADDDGLTVCCDLCNRWQHQLCYYPHFEDKSLPDNLEHHCLECRPREFDIAGARARQTVRREEQASLVNGAKRQPSKSHKKKPKEPGHTNGWPLEKVRHDRNSASPRDLPPPAKRPKTSHRTSDSTVGLPAKSHSRKRNASIANHQRSVSHSPDLPTEHYSREFIRCYHDDHWEYTDVNLFNSTTISNEMSAWLSASEEDFRAQHKLGKTDIFMRYDGELEDIPNKAQIEIRQMHDPSVKDENNIHPTWKMVTVQESVAEGGYIGELKGHIGFKEEYVRDPANRWELLRHPEPFVFFHPVLPVCIDARNEGSKLRYVRRSCFPNAKLSVIVTDATEYRFCFTALRQIDPGAEVAVGWDMSDSVPNLIHRIQNGHTMSDHDMDQLTTWISIVLANCGPCACQQSSEVCGMSRLDRRGMRHNEWEQDSPPPGMPPGKTSKAASHISPLDTHAVSRSESEAQRADHEDEHTDSRSASGSVAIQSGSREITPGNHASLSGSMSAATELSERERKKLAKEEEMFRRQEEEKGTKGLKKKRNSGAGSSNPPSATPSRQHTGSSGSAKYADASTSKQTGAQAPNKASKPPKLPSGSSVRTPVKSTPKVAKRPKPEYVDAEVQCDLDAEDLAARPAHSKTRRPFLSTTQRLLQRCALNNARRRKSSVIVEDQRRTNGGGQMDIDANEAQMHSEDEASELSKAPPDAAVKPDVDAEMIDADAHVATSSPTNEDLKDYPNHRATPPPTTSVPIQTPSHLPMDPPAPPWPSQASHSTTPVVSQQDASPSAESSRPVDLHIPMPPPPLNPFAGATLHTSTLSAGPSANLTGSLPVQSPLSVGLATSPMFSPSITAAVSGPSPARKKMSLSDYTKRSKAKDSAPDAVKGERESSPASVASGPAAPPLFQASSSELAKVAEDGGSAIVSEEDVVKVDASVGANDGGNGETATTQAPAL